MKQKKGAVSTTHAVAAPDTVARGPTARVASQPLNRIEGPFPSWLVTRSAYVLIALPFLLGLLYVYRYGTNIGWEDSYEFTVDLLQKWYAGRLTFADLWAQQNEHRLLFGYAGALAVALVTHWNAVAEMYLTQLCLLAMMGVYLYVFMGTSTSRFRGWLFVPIAFLVFSVRQYQPLLMNMSVAQVAVETVAALFCLCLLNQPQWTTAKFLGAVFFAVVGSYTQGQGLPVWPLGLLPLLLTPLSKRRKIVLGTIWCATAIVVLLVYFWGWKNGPGQVRMFSMEYFATIVGAAIFPDLSSATVGGVIILLLSTATILLTLRFGKARQYSFWLTLLVYGVLVNAQVTVGRGSYNGFSPAQAMSSRYAMFSLLTVIGLYAILSSLLNGEKLTRLVSALWGATLALVVLGVVLSSIEGYQIGAFVKQQRDYHVFVFLTYDTQPDEALPTAPPHKGAVIRPQLKFLKEHGLSVFHSPDPAANWTLLAQGLPVLPFPARFQMNQLQVNNEHGQRGLFTFSGIALDGKENEPVGGVFFEVDNVTYPAYYGIPREDVAQALKTSRVTKCGFRRDFSVSQLGPGRHTLRIRAVSRDRTALYAPTNPVSFEFPPIPEVAGNADK